MVKKKKRSIYTDTETSRNKMLKRRGEKGRFFVFKNEWLERTENYFILKEPFKSRTSMIVESCNLMMDLLDAGVSVSEIRRDYGLED
jgi:hypothetical protein